jgi:hypothetical protein
VWRAILHPRDRRGRFADRISASTTPKPGWQPTALVDDVANPLRSTGETSLPNGSWARRQRDGSIRVHTTDGRETTIKKSGMLDSALSSMDDAQMAATILLHASAKSTRRRSLGGAHSFAGGLWDAALLLAMGGGGHTHEMGRGDPQAQTPDGQGVSSGTVTPRSISATRAAPERLRIIIRQPVNDK